MISTKLRGDDINWSFEKKNGHVNRSAKNGDDAVMLEVWCIWKMFVGKKMRKNGLKNLKKKEFPSSNHSIARLMCIATSPSLSIVFASISISTLNFWWTEHLTHKTQHHRYVPYDEPRKNEKKTLRRQESNERGERVQVRRNARRHCRFALVERFASSRSHP